MTESTTPAQCSDADWKLARKCGLFSATPGTNTWDAALGRFADGIRATNPSANAEQAQPNAMDARVYCGGDPEAPRVSFDTAAPMAQEEIPYTVDGVRMSQLEYIEWLHLELDKAQSATQTAPQIDMQAANAVIAKHFSNDPANAVRAQSAFTELLAQATSASHPDDVAVDMFAKAMKEKLAQARAKGRSGWQTCSKYDLSNMLREHVEKGDPRDVANFCMFLHALGHAIQIAPKAPAALTDDRWKRMSQFLSDVMTAAGLVSYGRQSKALGERLGTQCSELSSELYAVIAATPAAQAPSVKKVHCNCSRPDPEDGYCQNCGELEWPTAQAPSASAEHDESGRHWQSHDDGLVSRVELSVAPATPIGWDLTPRDVAKGAAPAALTVTDDMVSRFLGWRLPDDFSPDCGVSFTPVRQFTGELVGWPVGTNLLSAIQARAMLEHVLAVSVAQLTDEQIIDSKVDEEEAS